MSRHLPFATLVTGAVMMAAACASSASPTTHTCSPPYPTGTPDETTVLCADPATLEPAKTVRIIDGDTLDVTIDGTEARVRLFGVDTPERGDACFREATDRLRALAGDEVLLRRDARDRDRNGRLLRYVYTTGGVSIDALLITEGLARAWTRDGAARDALVALEADAAAEHAGCIWP